MERLKTLIRRIHQRRAKVAEKENRRCGSLGISSAIQRAALPCILLFFLRVLCVPVVNQEFVGGLRNREEAS
jgi:hypothetical protein